MGARRRAALSLLLIADGVVVPVGVLGRTTEQRRSMLPLVSDRLIVDNDSG